MSNQTPMQAIVTPATAAKNNQGSVSINLFYADGTPASTVKKAAAQADTTAADLAALKVDFNALLAKLRTAGVIASS
jgi:hypothetical protein